MVVGESSCWERLRGRLSRGEPVGRTEAEKAETGEPYLLEPYCGKEGQSPPTPRTVEAFCRVCGGDEEHRLVTNLTKDWKAWACNGCNVMKHGARP